MALTHSREVNYSPKIAVSGLRGLLDAANIKSYSGSGSVWNDLTPYGNNFTHTNVTYNSSGYFTYNGTNSGSISGTPSGFSADNASSSVGVWFRPAVVPPSANMAIITDNFGPEYGIWLLSNGNAAGYAYGGVGATAALNTWTYCVITVVAGVPNTTDTYLLKFYKDGEYVNQASGTVGNGMNDWPLTLGYDQQSGNPTGYFSGDIARVELYQKVLTDAEVKRNFNAIRGRFGI